MEKHKDCQSWEGKTPTEAQRKEFILMRSTMRDGCEIGDSHGFGDGETLRVG